MKLLILDYLLLHAPDPLLTHRALLAERLHQSVLFFDLLFLLQESVFQLIALSLHFVQNFQALHYFWVRKRYLLRVAFAVLHLFSLLLHVGLGLLSDLKGTHDGLADVKLFEAEEVDSST